MEDIRWPQVVNGDCLCSTLNVDGIGLIAPVEDPVFSDIRSLEGFQRAPCCKNTCEAVARSLKMNVDVTTCWDAGMGQSFPMWTLSQDAKSVMSVCLAGEGAKNSPGNCRGEPYT